MSEERVEGIKHYLKNNLLIVFGIGFILGISLSSIYFSNTQEDHCVQETYMPEEVVINQEIVVDLAGAVKKPGVFAMEGGSRLGELISKGGGIHSEASLEWVSKNLNLSQKLEDTQKVYIPFEWEIQSYEEVALVPLVGDVAEIKSKVVPKDISVSTETKVNVNLAPLEELDTLPGIGPAYAQRIIDNRNYIDIEDFNVKSGLSDATIEKISDLISF